MYKIAIIGVGQLGSRHLQALTTTKLNIDIELVEPYEPMQETALERYNQMPKNENINSVNFFNSISQLSDTLDLVIVATTANVRRVVVDELIDNKKVKNILLEKVLFQDYEDYDHFSNRFTTLGINVWVNHPRRLFSFYEQFLPKLKTSSQISYHVQGGEWGMACNALHFMDHLQMIQSDPAPQIHINTSNLTPSVVESKRKGCYEVYGTLSGTIGNGSYSLTCTEGDVIPTTISIMADTIRIIVDEYKGIAMIATKENDWLWERYEGKIVHYQSELTGLVADDILLDGACALPTYQDASSLHKPFIEKIQTKIETTLDIEFGLCPIS